MLNKNAKFQASVSSLLLRVAACAAVVANAGAAHATDSSGQNSLTFTGGGKLWENSWQSWIVVPTVFNQASREVVEPINSSTALAVVPQLSARYGSWLGSVSTLLPTNYTLRPSYGTSLAASRSEVDGNLGYYVLPGLAVTAGYKQLEQKFGGTYRWRGPTVGLSGTAGLDKGASLYGTIGFGFMKVELPFVDSAGDTSRNANYVLGEVGIVYSFGNLGWFAKSLNLTLGYRSQTVTTKSYGLLDSNVPPKVSRQDVRDITQGATLGVVAVF